MSPDEANFAVPPSSYQWNKGLHDRALRTFWYRLTFPHGRHLILALGQPGEGEWHDALFLAQHALGTINQRPYQAALNSPVTRPLQPWGGLSFFWQAWTGAAVLDLRQSLSNKCSVLASKRIVSHRTPISQGISYDPQIIHGPGRAKHEGRHDIRAYRRYFASRNTQLRLDLAWRIFRLLICPPDIAATIAYHIRGPFQQAPTFEQRQAINFVCHADEFGDERRCRHYRNRQIAFS